MGDPWTDEDLRAFLKKRFGKPTIEELEAILDKDEDCPIMIMPNGEIRAMDGGAAPPKVMTMRENLGGEYAAGGRA